jgi:hypothetical protein
MKIYNTRFNEAEEDFLSEIKQRTGLKKAEIVRRACRFSLPKFLSGEVNILDMVSNFEDTWDVDFEPEEVKRAVALRKLGVKTQLCATVTIGKKDDKFFACWTEQHPELGFYDEYFGSKRTPKRLRRWQELTDRMPVTNHVSEITRREAFEIITAFWLPAEFHRRATRSESGMTTMVVKTLRVTSRKSMA